MRPHKRIRELTPDEYQALREGTRSSAGFTTRRSHMLLLSAEGLSALQRAQRLLCGEQTVRNALRAFEAEGLACLQQKSNRPHRDSSAFDQAGLQRLAELGHRSPRDLGLPTSLWTLEWLAQVCWQQGIVQQAISYETVRKALLKLGIDWQSARQRITSHDPQYAHKKTTGAAHKRFDVGKYRILNTTYLPLVTSRGCPFNCAFCAGYKMCGRGF